MGRCAFIAPFLQAVGLCVDEESQVGWMPAVGKRPCWVVVGGTTGLETAPWPRRPRSSPGPGCHGANGDFGQGFGAIRAVPKRVWGWAPRGAWALASKGEDAVLTPLNMSTETTREEMLDVVSTLDRQVFDLLSLLKAGRALFTELNIEGICQLLIAMVRERSGMEQVAIILHWQESAQMKVAAQTGLSDATANLSFPNTDGVLWRLLRSGEPFSVVDSSGSPRFPEFFRRHGLEALGGAFWVPLVVGDRVVGVISVGGPGLEKVPTAEDHHFLHILASQAAGALATAKLYQSVAVARRQLDRSLHNLSMLFDVTRALGAISDLTRLLKLILERACAAVGAEKGSLMLLDEATDELVIRVVRGLPDKEVERKINNGEIECRRFRRGEGVAGKVIELGHTIRVNDVDRAQDFKKSDGSHVQSILCVPLNVDEEIIGVINITNKNDNRTFEKEDESILEALANQAAVAIARTRLYEAAITDGLTGLFIRRFIMHRFTEEQRRAKRYKTPLSVVMCDIDHFKSVNDTHGHQVGDEVIVEVARVLSQGVREDIDIVGRYGGEEFMVILPQTALDGSVQAADRVREAVEAIEVALPDGGTLKVTASFGTAEFNQDDPNETIESCLKRADDALYDAKRGGRNQVCRRRHPDVPETAAAPSEPEAEAEPEIPSQTDPVVPS